MKSQGDKLLRFVTSSFRSVWALELLLLLKRNPRLWPRSELVATLRASELVVNKALDELVAAGLVSIEGQTAIYQPVSADVADCVDQVEKLYAGRPDAVRRAIVAAAGGSDAAAFADAFKLRKE